MTDIEKLKAAALAASKMYPEWNEIVKDMNADGYVSFLTDYVSKVDPTILLSLIGRLEVAEKDANIPAKLQGDSH